MENENEFVDIIGFEGLYQINRNGDIRSLKRNKLMKFNIDNGYYRICLTKDKIEKKYNLHRLLAIQFIPNPDNLPEIDHIDRNSLNNNLVNLRWCDRTTNVRNKIDVINREGFISTLKITKKGTYQRATFPYDYKKRFYKCSYDKNELEEWLREMKNLYPRSEIYV